MALIGYLRVSTHDQNLDLQRDALMHAGADRVFVDEGVSGSTIERQGLADALDYCRAGDTFAVWRLDRLGRNLTHVRNTINELRARGVHFRSLTEGLTDEGAMGKMMIDILGAFAEFERNVMIERTQAGLAAARARGHKGGRRKLLDEAKVEEMRKLKAQGFTVARLADMFHVSEPSVYRYVRN
ncbi:DNA-invertase hin (plasmid) [Arthrobacter sp. Hiyo8]|uniref:Recombinase family protein n=1 Tax=Arthrobacter gyeryongensis TaxID=1650592 RepID=A0ABP8VA79_9MICC|nr:DNA-invertase hin [Arthrobacter sp. Hiyo8]BAS18723.1 DNA-invertase hin [Arthrobacter sp. Hiyo8]BAS18732.1 DNA-invertase hin [Arthrobacter sp. Hiyo8]